MVPPGRGYWGAHAPAEQNGKGLGGLTLGVLTLGVLTLGVLTLGGLMARWS